MTSRETVVLPDGRTLSYIEAGDRQGVPVLFTMGTPSSAVGGLAFASAAERTGIKLLSIDKPGYGLSSRDPKRTVLRYGHDLVAMADALGLDRVALAGQSGGGPHAIAAAYALGERVSTLCLISSAGPLAEKWAREDLNGMMSTMSWFARTVPGLLGLPLGAMKLLMGNPQRMERLAKGSERKMSPAQLEAMKAPETALVLEGLQDSLNSGLGGVKDEFHAIGTEWGFRLQDVTAPTDMWHGTSDTSCPIVMARNLARRLPNVALHELEGVGHNFFGTELDTAFADLRAKADTASG